MLEMQQSDTYEEDNAQVGPDESAEADEDTSTHISSIWGIPIPVLIMICAGVIVLIIAGVVITTRKPKESAAKRLAASTEQPVTSAPVQSTPAPSAKTEVFVDGQSYGYITGTPQPGAFVFAEDGSALAVLAESGDTVLMDASGNVVGYVAASASSATSSANTIDTAVAEKLRMYGYTGDEIELAMKTNANIDDLIAQAQELQDIAAKEALARVSDSASDEYKEMVSSTMYCMPYQQFKSFAINDPNVHNATGSYIVNADYEKIPTYGYQLNIKVKIANGTYAFMPIQPQRYMSLPDSGNIVVKVEYAILGPSHEDTNFYITNITEVDITTLTVNPEDSGIDLETIKGGN